jgi:carboxypeptidase Q
MMGAARFKAPRRRITGFLLVAVGLSGIGLQSGPLVWPAQNLPYADIAEKIRTSGLRTEYAYELLKKLTGLGPRLTGSAQAAAAVELTRRMMTEIGLETWLEGVTVQHWVRGVEEAAILVPGAEKNPELRISALGWSIPTGNPAITAPILEVRSFEELQKVGPEAKGKIVFFNHPMDRTFSDTFPAYGEAAAYRARGAAEASKWGAAAVIVRSLTLRVDAFPHTGMVQYDPRFPRIPAAAVATADADRLSALLVKEKRVEIRLRMGCQTLPDVPSANVVGQIRGSDLPDEIILVGGHLDSWDLGTGAHDDGAGCVQAMEALRLIAELGLKPKRTIRAVLFMNEEFGSSGGRDYAREARRKREKHLVAMESDRGGFLPVGFGVGGASAIEDRLKTWQDLLRPAGILWFGPGGGGADVGPLAAQGAVMMSFIPDSQKYFDYHHSALDILEAVHPRELELGAIVLAVMAYVLAQEGI